MQNKASNSFLAQGFAVGLQDLTGLLFRPAAPHTYCRICGSIYQSDVDRDPVGVYEKQPADFDFDLNNVALFATGLRKEWSQKHAKSHPEHLHKSLALSKRHCTPEAAHKLAAFGIFSLIDLALDDEVSNALRESSSVPLNDVEGT